MSGLRKTGIPKSRIDVRCDIDIEQTPRSLHAHAVPDGVALRPGDVVLVHDAPTGIAFGDRLCCERRATVRRAGRLMRFWTRATAVFALTTLYEVGFEASNTIRMDHA